MHIEFLVEELSAEVALRNLLPSLIGDKCSYQIHPFQGKTNLLDALEKRLRGYRTWIPSDWRIVILVDRDDDDCAGLKDRMEAYARKAGLPTKSSSAEFVVVNRIAVEELEAWFFGDIQALTSAYPGVSPSLAYQARYRSPDDIRGGTWEALERVLQRAGYFKGGLPKTRVAGEVSRHMVPARNTSPSFLCFARAVEEIVRQ